MANVTETPDFDAGVYRIETTDPVIGGENGIANKGIKNLANRTLYLKEHLDVAETNISSLQSRSAAPQFLRNGVTELTVDQTPETTVDFDQVDTLYSVTNAAGASQVSIINLPEAGIYPNGTPIAFAVTGGNNTAVVNLRVSGDAGSDRIVDVGRGGQSSESAFLRLGDYITLFSNGTDKWIAFLQSNDMVGAVSAFAMSVAPSGWLKANGAAISRTSFARLFSVIGTTFGAGDGSTTFNLPDMRGEFLRGFDDSRGVDTSTIALVCNTLNASLTIECQDGTSGLFVGMTVTGTGIAPNTVITGLSRTAIAVNNFTTATNAGITLTFSQTRTFGSSQADMIKRHEHFLGQQANIVNGASPTTATIVDYDSASFANRYLLNTEYFGGLETRPRNIALLYCIKF
jgi:microcystin-dependent protein